MGNGTEVEVLITRIYVDSGLVLTTTTSVEEEAPVRPSCIVMGILSSSQGTYERPRLIKSTGKPHFASVDK